MSESQRFSGWSKEELVERIQALESGAHAGIPMTSPPRSEDQIDALDVQLDGVLHAPIADLSSMKGSTLINTQFDGADSTSNHQGYLNSTTRESCGDVSWLLPLGFMHRESLVQIDPNLQDGRSTNGLAQLSFPDPEEESQLLLSYFDNMHRRLPFLDMSNLQTLAKAKREIPATHVGKDFESAKLCFVYAIGAKAARLTRNSNTISQPEEFYKAGLRAMPAFEVLGGTQKVEAGLLIVLYLLRTALTSDVWYMIGTCMRVAVDVGLHKAAFYKGLDASTAQLRKKLFWCVYSMERSVAWALKRPFSIADADIDETLVFYSSENSETSMLHDISGISRKTRPFDETVFGFTVNLTRIKSRIYNKIYSASKAREDVLWTVHSFLDELLVLAEKCKPFQSSDKDFAQLHLNNAIRDLIEPFLPKLTAQDDLVKHCLNACGKMCQMFKGMRIRGSLAVSVLMVRSVFTAGMTICYILAKAPNLWSPACINDLRACSSSLVVIAERNEKFKAYYEVLEDLITAVMDRLSADSDQGNQDTATSPISEVSDRSKAFASGFDNLSEQIELMDFAFPLDSWPSYLMEAASRLENRQYSDQQSNGIQDNTGTEQPQANAADDRPRFESSPGSLQSFIANLDSMNWNQSHAEFDTSPFGNFALLSDPLLQLG